MEIIKYDYNSKIEYSSFIRKYNKSKYMHTLNVQTISKDKSKTIKRIIFGDKISNFIIHTK